MYSALFALCVSYTIWYAAVREIGSARTSAYSNVVPLVAMTTAVIFLGEPLDLRKIAGAAAVLIGVALTRVKTRQSSGITGFYWVLQFYTVLKVLRVLQGSTAFGGALRGRPETQQNPAEPVEP